VQLHPVPHGDHHVPLDVIEAVVGGHEFIRRLTRQPALCLLISFLLIELMSERTLRSSE
jgi:hypothetical protein